MKINNVTCINLNKNKMKENELCKKIKNNKMYCNESNNSEKAENKNRSKLNLRTSNDDIKDKRKHTKLIKVNKEANEANDNLEISKKYKIDEQKLNENGIIKNKEIPIDTKIIEKNIEKIENAMKKLDEIEKKLIDDIYDCDKYIEFYDKSKSLLDSKDFDSDVGREEEINEIRTILKKCSNNFKSDGIFLTGPSGQGKTYSIFYIINEIEKEKKQKKKEKMEHYKNIDSSYFYVSCSNSEKPYDIFVDILQQILNKDRKSILNNIKQKYNLNGLEEVKKLFINYTSKLNNLKIVIVDELDFIAVKNVRMELRAKTHNKNYNEDVVKVLFECSQNTKCKIILVGIANSLDLIKDYTHLKINQIIYKPYNEKQFMNIIKNKLNSLEDEFVNKIFKGVSLNIHVRQISNRNGDIRSCFDAILRVFSDKRSDLEERKRNLIKLKEEILMNKIFNNQEKRNLCLLLNNQCKDDKKKEFTNDQKSSRENNNDIELSTNKRANSKKREKDDKDSLSRTNKKLKMGSNNANETNIYNEDISDTFFLEKNETPLLHNRDYNMESKFSKDAQKLKFTDLKNENTFGYETLKKEIIKIQNNNETLSEILIRKNFNANGNESLYNYSQYTPKQYYESPFKVLYKNEDDSNILYFRDKEDILNNINVEKLESFDLIIDNQIKSIENKYENFLSMPNNNTVMISDIKKITDKIPLEEHKDILFKIQSLPLIQKICLYASCNVINDTHLNLDDEDQEDISKNEIKKNIEITYYDIKKCFRAICSQLSETSCIKDILEGNTIDQAIEHFEELGILTNTKKNQKVKEKSIKIPKGLTPRFANKKNNNFSSQNKLNSVYYFNLPVCVIKQTLKEISSILSSLDKSVNF
ncbi:conserved Plasmodium protein, unknown function [Plasmodium relictum]|uniref:ORC1/DEAH AAA+ ATPase domain-containing protein n=1 Tax=Plasmodium relictum TaxID=85471 RepID=A0A1J1H7V6_PLARL|nr:conserved Plasmodium protein, unknown function [Plasmodium relictum]CRH00637.1 conserved Plasmodium protein, unknown function [Plasmodium relictum]